MRIMSKDLPRYWTDLPVPDMNCTLSAFNYVGEDCSDCLINHPVWNCPCLSCNPGRIRYSGPPLISELKKLQEWNELSKKE